MNKGKVKCLIIIVAAVFVLWLALHLLCVQTVVSKDGNWKLYVVKGYHDVANDWSQGILCYTGDGAAPETITVTRKDAGEDPVVMKIPKDDDSWDLEIPQRILLLHGKSGMYSVFDSYGSNTPVGKIEVQVIWKEGDKNMRQKLVG